MPDVQIGGGALVGAQSVVVSDAQPYTIVAGNSARLVRRYLDEELTDLMLRWKWRDLSVDEINSRI